MSYKLPNPKHNSKIDSPQKIHKSIFDIFSCCLQSSPFNSNTNSENYSLYSHTKYLKKMLPSDHYSLSVKETFNIKNEETFDYYICDCNKIIDTKINIGQMSENLRVLNMLMKYPKNEMFLLNYNSHCILAKISSKNFKFSIQKKNPNAFKTQISSNKNLNKIDLESEEEEYESASFPLQNIAEIKNFGLFNRTDLGVKFDYARYTKTTPEVINDFFGNKLSKNSFVVDAYCGVGEASIPFVKKGLNVIGIEKSDKYVNFAKHNAKVHDIQNIDFIEGEFININFGKFKTETVFLNINYEYNDYNEKFCIFKHLKPDIRLILKKAFSLAENLIMIFPKQIEISELALLFGDYFESKKINPFFNSIEIECININNKTEKVAVYYGKPCNVKPILELEYIITFLSKDSNSEWSILQIQSFINQIIPKIGIYQIIKLLNEINNSEKKNNETIFQKFIELLKKKCRISKEEILEYLSEDKFKNYSLNISENIKFSSNSTINVYKINSYDNIYENNERNDKSYDNHNNSLSFISWGSELNSPNFLEKNNKIKKKNIEYLKQDLLLKPPKRNSKTDTGKISLKINEKKKSVDLGNVIFCNENEIFTFEDKKLPISE